MKTITERLNDMVQHEIAYATEQISRINNQLDELVVYPNDFHKPRQLAEELLAEKHYWIQKLLDYAECL